MTSSPSTLHDFVLNLLSDPAAKAAFLADAQGTLEQAGLADISAVDVQEVIPLVLDLVPSTESLPALDGVHLGLPTEDLLAEGPLGAISQLQAVASQLTSSGVSLNDVNTSSAGVLAADQDGLTVFAANNTVGEYSAAALQLGGDFSVVGDVTSVLDQATSPVAGTALDVADTATATVDSTAFTATSLVPGTDSVLGHLGGVTGLGGDLLGVVGGADANVNGLLHVEGVNGLTQGDFAVSTTDTVSEVTQLTNGVTGTATGVVDSATGLVGDTAGVGGVVGNVTDAAGVDKLPVVGDLGLDGLL